MMGKLARANRREKQRIRLQVARAELVLLLDGKVTPFMMELDGHKTENLLQCVKRNGYVPYWAQPEQYEVTPLKSQPLTKELILP